ncbi:MAG: hypothetical protein IT302_15350 [Dehalococcoidia bacterium]|nr:hypothetical protein [Dehalococcoidia bacterium]
MFTLIFMSLFLAGWLLCAGIPWFALSVKTRGNAGLRYLPLCLFAGVVAALAIPILGLDDGRGVALSFVAAFTTPTLLLAARRFSLPRTAPHPETGDAPR